MVIVLNLEVVQSDAQKIGDPQMYDKVHAGGGAPPAQNGAGPPPQQYGGPPPQQYGGPPQAYNAGGGFGGPPPGNQPGSAYGGPPPNQGELCWLAALLWPLCHCDHRFPPSSRV